MSRLLLIDDQLLLLEILQMALEGEHMVITARSGQEGLEIIEQLQIDLVLTDYSMPGMDGLEVLRQIQARKNPPRVILYSACLNEKIVSEAMALGAVACMPKPFDLDELRHRIRQILDTGL